MTDAAGNCAEVSARTEAHETLEPFVGTFRAKVRLWMGQADPMVSAGTMNSTWDLDGRFLKQDYRGDPNPGPFGSFEGRGYFGYNTVSKKYEGFWIDNASTMMHIESGSVDASGKVWTMIGEMTDPQSGGVLKKRSVIKVTDNDHHSLEMFFSKPGVSEFKTMEIEYERAR